jgi:hypothetical protein
VNMSIDEEKMDIMKKLEAKERHDVATVKDTRDAHTVSTRERHDVHFESDVIADSKPPGGQPGKLKSSIKEGKNTSHEAAPDHFHAAMRSSFVIGVRNVHNGCI